MRRAKPPFESWKTCKEVAKGQRGKSSTRASYLFHVGGRPKASLEHVHGGVDPGVRLPRPDPHAGVDADDALLLEPLGGVVVEGEEEHLQHAVPESRQAGVVDHVEEEDEEPGLGGAGEEGPGLRVVDEVADRLPAVPLDGLDGGAPEQLGGVVADALPGGRHGQVVE